MSKSNDSNFASAVLASHGVADERIFLRTEAGETTDYGALGRAARRMAARLAALGVRPGDRVAVRIDKSPEAVVLYFASLWSGAVYLPLNSGYTLTELSYFLDDAEPSLVVCSPRDESAIGELIGSRPSMSLRTLGEGGSGTLLDGWPSEVEGEPAAFRAADDIAAILYTSGTTGRPKGAMITHGNLAANAGTLADVWRFTLADVLIHALPIFHIHGLFVAINVVAVARASLIFLQGFNDEAVLARMPEATVLMGVPTFYTRLLANPRLTPAVARNMRLFISGSAPLLAETHRAWRERTGHSILERYGMTETGMNTSNPYAGDRRAGTVGLPLPGVSLRIRRGVDSLVAGTGEIGGIEVKGPNVFRGYWRAPDKTRQEFSEDGFFKTGDLGIIDEQGYVHIVGRSKDLIISGGYNVYPKEVEAEIDQIPGIAESAVIGLPHADFGEAVAAVVVGDISETDILTRLAGRLARYKLPKHIFIVEALPRNTMGKVQKNILRERYASGQVPSKVV